MRALQISSFQYSLYHILLPFLRDWPREMYFSPFEGAIRTKFLEVGLLTGIIRVLWT